MSRHTPEPWYAIADYGILDHPSYQRWRGEDRGGFREIVSDNGERVVGGAWRQDSDADIDIDSATMGRILDCINALAGIPDPEKFVKAARELAHQYANGTLNRQAIDAFCASDRQDAIGGEV